jgi:hypothetical protein
MDASEARTLLAERLRQFREYPHDRLVGLVGSCHVEERRGPAGTMYQLEFQFFWDAQPGGSVRVIGSIDDGGIRALVPLFDAFIKAPNGNFVGE